MATKRELDFELEYDVLTPKAYHVFILNDDYTPMDFVIDILISIFHKSYSDAEKIMLMVHEKGKGLCGTFSYEIAETKIMQVTHLAKENGHPLKAIMEEA